MSTTATKKRRVLGAPVEGIRYNLSDNYQPKSPKLFGNWAADGRGCGGGTKDRDDLVEEKPENVAALPPRKWQATAKVPAGWGAQIRAVRKQRGWKLQEAADMLGIPMNTLSSWESDNPERINSSRFEAACRLFGVQP